MSSIWLQFEWCMNHKWKKKKSCLLTWRWMWNPPDVWADEPICQVLYTAHWNSDIFKKLCSSVPCPLPFIQSLRKIEWGWIFMFLLPVESECLLETSADVNTFSWIKPTRTQSCLGKFTSIFSARIPQDGRAVLGQSKNTLEHGTLQKPGWWSNINIVGSSQAATATFCCLLS